MSNTSSSCNCIGPQNGAPLCPCMMRGVQVIDNRYVRIQDLGPVPGIDPSFNKFEWKADD